MTSLTRSRRAVWMAWVCGLSVGWVSVAHAQVTAADDVYALRDLKRLERTFARLAEQAHPVVVAIQTRRVVGQDRQRTAPNSQGSGFVIGSDGYIATNHHVIEGADQIIVTLFSGIRHDATVVEFDPRSDLAVIRVDARNLRVAEFASAEDLRIGQWCFTVGSPFGVANRSGKVSFSFGGIAAMGRSLTDYIPSNGNDRFYGNLIETDASINPGNSGGPLFDLEGRVIGVNTAMISGSGVDEGLGFAVPMSARTRYILQTLRSGQVVRYGYLGVQIADADRNLEVGPGARRGRGAVIKALTGNAETSPAARAGLLPTDVITEFGGEAIRGRDDLIRVVGATPVGSAVNVTYYRSRQRLNASVRLAERVETAAARARSRRIDHDGLRTMTWRGALLVEPTEAFLLSRANTREKPGLYVADVSERTSLYRRGLREHSLIVSVNGKRVRTLEDFKRCEKNARREIRLELDSGETVRVPR
jgi:serine protease Do